MTTVKTICKTMKPTFNYYKWVSLQMRSAFILFVLIVAGFIPNKLYSQHFGIKTNTMYWATTTTNLGFEFRTSRKWSIELVGGYNPWNLGNNGKMIKHWMVQSEARYWLCETFEGHFFGLHVQGGEFNINKINLPKFVFGNKSNNYRFQGFFVGGGISYGYQWILNNKWLLEANIGIGYNYLTYEKFDSDDCGCSQGNFTPSPGYFGPTKLGLSFIYLIK